MSVKIFQPAGCLVDGEYRPGFALAAEDGKILDVRPFGALRAVYGEAEVESWPELALVPGTVNAHNHSFQSLLRGIAADRPFLEWRDESLYKDSPKLRVQDIYTGEIGRAHV